MTATWRRELALSSRYSLCSRSRGTAFRQRRVKLGFIPGSARTQAHSGHRCAEDAGADAAVDAVADGRLAVGCRHAAVGDVHAAAYGRKCCRRAAPNLVVRHGWLVFGQMIIVLLENPHH